MFESENTWSNKSYTWKKSSLSSPQLEFPIRWCQFQRLMRLKSHFLKRCLLSERLKIRKISSSWVSKSKNHFSCSFFFKTTSFPTFACLPFPPLLTFYLSAYPIALNARTLYLMTDLMFVEGRRKTSIHDIFLH